LTTVGAHWHNTLFFTGDPSGTPLIARKKQNSAQAPLCLAFYHDAVFFVNRRHYPKIEWEIRPFSFRSLKLREKWCLDRCHSFRVF